MAVFKDCNQTLPKVLLKWWLSKDLLKWWLSLEIVIKDCLKICWSDGGLQRHREKTREKTANLQRLEKRIREKTAEKDCYSKFSEKVLKYILFLSGRRDRTCGFGNPFVTSCVSDAQNCGKMQIFHVAERPFTQKVIVGRSKLW